MGLPRDPSPKNFRLFSYVTSHLGTRAGSRCVHHADVNRTFPMS